MTFAAIFVRRPVGTTLLAIGLVFVGLVSFRLLPVASLPLVDLSAISISASLPGASPETMASAVATPLERQFSHIAGITSMNSASTLGVTQIRLTFDYGRDANGAARDVEAAINAARTYLRANLPANPSYRKLDSARAPVLVLNLTSAKDGPGALYDTASSIIQQKIGQIGGVGQVQILGGSLPAVRVELDPMQLSRYGISLPSLAGILAGQNANQPKGQVTVGGMTLDILANDQISRAADYRSLVIGGAGNDVVQLQDVSEVNDSVQSVRSVAYVNGRESVSLLVYCLPGANVISTVDAIKQEIPNIRASLPRAQHLAVTADLTTTIRASVLEVERTLLLSVVLVVLVVFVFLRDVRSTFIPGAAVAASLIGTFAGMYLCGYTLDNLSLMALAISTGFVVDDAIVVMENIARLMELGASPREAALRGARETSPTVLSMSLSLIAVFVPVLFMGGLAGRLFHEFAAVLVLSIALSMVVSLTLTPMMCAVMLRRQSDVRHSRLYQRMEAAFGALLQRYASSLGRAMAYPSLVMLVFLATIALNFLLLAKVRKGFFPIQDTGALIGGLEAPQDASFAAVQRSLREVERVIQSDPAVDVVTGFTGASSGPGSGDGSNSAFLFVSLRPLAQRKLSATQVLDRLRPQLEAIQGAQTQLKPVQDLPSEGKQSNANYQYQLTADNTDGLKAAAGALLQAMKRLPQVKDVALDLKERGLQTKIVYDRRTAARLGITPQMIDQSLYGVFGQAQVSTIYTALNQYYVVMEAGPQHTTSPAALHSLYLTPPNGGVVPLDAVAKWSQTTSPIVVNHQGLFPAATISFNLAPGISEGQAMDAINALQQQIGIPHTVRGTFPGQGTGGLSQSTVDQIVLIVIALATVYIVLGMLYESFLHPLTILSTLPPTGVGAVLALILFGSELDVISVIGIFLLIGIVKKNAIMMIDASLVAERVAGRSADEAIFEACLLRFRPIMMTTLAALFGALPLAFGHGTGSELRRPLGISVVGGLVVSQIMTLYTTPVLYLLQYRLQRRFSARRGLIMGAKRQPM